MYDLSYRQQKIQQKRKNTPWREFVMECASWQQFSFYKHPQGISRYPVTQRINKTTHADTFYESNDGIYIEYSKDESFFKNYKRLWESMSLPLLWKFGPGNENSEYADTIYNTKNAYLSVSTAFDTQNMLYSLECHGNLDTVISSVGVHSNSSNIFQCAGVADSFDIFYSYNIQNSSSIWFSSNLTGCLCCLFCNNLINQSYCIENKQYSKEEYHTIFGQYVNNKNLFDTYRARVDHSASVMLGCEDVSAGKFVSYVTTARNICLVGGDKEAKRNNLFDVWSSGGSITDAYACMGVSPGDNFYCVINSGFVQSIFYSYFMANCSFCLGCIGLRNKSYCIFNKQYTKEERYEKVDEIFTQMEQEGTLGQFFPGWMNPFYFNDTAAYLIDPTFTKEEVEAKGYLRRDEPIKVDIPDRMETVKVSELEQYEGRDNGVRTIDPSVLKKVIIDETGNSYRIIKMEYDFLMKYGLPLPRKHRLERMKENFRIN